MYINIYGRKENKLIRKADIFLSEIQSLLKISMLLLTALVAETHLAERLTLKLRLTVTVEYSLIDLLGMRRQTESKMDEQQILPLKTLIIKRASRCLLLI
jgi:hypothetical protein